MKCPACGNSLSSIPVGELTVDACQGGCGGIWFDRLELAKVDESSQSAGEKLLQIARNPAVKFGPDNRPRLSCPRCGVIMMRHFFSVKKQVLVDECPQCGGTWLDAGELATIRSEFNTEETRKKATEAYFDEVFGKQLAVLHAQDEANAAQAQKLAHLFRFICPSYYLPGKQKWGAF
jgi:uncharacterized protein